MGNEVSTPYDGPPILLEAKDIPGLAKYIQSDLCRKVCVMLGAGVSTAAGIPDFRSPGTGLYSNLARLNLPQPEAVFEINYFRQNPIPFYTLARELYPGKFRPTLTHSFVKLLATKGLLDTCFTQNIDTLERRAGVPAERIVEAHGSFASQRCIDCRLPYDAAAMKAAVLAGTVVHCPTCAGLVKPDIVFFGESLPPLFHERVPRLRDADLLLVLGTSLTVHPFAALTQAVDDSCPRVLINMDPAGDVGARPDDVVLLGRCDDTVRALCRALGWEAELDAAWAETAGSVTLPREPDGEREEKALPPEPAVSAEDEVEVLTQRIGAALEISDRETEGPPVPVKDGKGEGDSEPEEPASAQPTEAEAAVAAETSPDTTATQAPTEEVSSVATKEELPPPSDEGSAEAKEKL